MKDLYMVFDSEVCNCPKIDGQLDTQNGQVYDFGLQIVDKQGFVYDQRSIVNEDVFFGMPKAMEEAFFANKIPQYLEGMRMGRHEIMNTWQMYKMVREMCGDYDVKACIAHNARFDIAVLNATIRYQTKSKRRWFFPY